MKKAVKKIPREESWARKLDAKTLALLNKMKFSISSKLRPKSKDDEFWESITSNISKKKEVSAPLPLSEIIPNQDNKSLLSRANSVKEVFRLSMKELKREAEERRRKIVEERKCKIAKEQAMKLAEIQFLEQKAIEDAQVNVAVKKMKIDIRNITLKTLSKLEKHARGNEKEDILRIKNKLRKH